MFWKRSTSRRWRIDLLDMNIYTDEVLEKSLESAGFKEIELNKNPDNSWICIKAVKA